MNPKELKDRYLYSLYSEIITNIWLAVEDDFWVNRP